MAGLGLTEEKCAYPQATPIQLANGVGAHALHVNGLTPHTPQLHSFLMTCNPCDKPQNFKGVIKDILRSICANPDEDYDTLHFTEVDTEGGNNT